MSVTTEQVYTVLGKLATTYSALQWDIELLLERLVGGNPFVLPQFIDRAPFSNSIKRCRKAARIRFRNTPARQERFMALMNRVKAMNERRNLFIHGQWTVEEDLLPKIWVHTFKLRRRESSGRWQYLDIHRTTLSELEAELLEASKLVHDVVAFRLTVKPSAGDWAARTDAV